MADPDFISFKTACFTTGNHEIDKNFIVNIVNFFNFAYEPSVIIYDGNKVIRLYMYIGFSVEIRQHLTWFRLIIMRKFIIQLIFIWGFASFNYAMAWPSITPKEEFTRTEAAAAKTRGVSRFQLVVANSYNLMNWHCFAHRIQATLIIRSKIFRRNKIKKIIDDDFLMENAQTLKSIASWIQAWPLLTAWSANRFTVPSTPSHGSRSTSRMHLPQTVHGDW